VERMCSGAGRKFGERERSGADERRSQKTMERERSAERGVAERERSGERRIIQFYKCLIEPSMLELFLAVHAPLTIRLFPYLLTRIDRPCYYYSIGLFRGTVLNVRKHIFERKHRKSFRNFRMFVN